MGTAFAAIRSRLTLLGALATAAALFACRPAQATPILPMIYTQPATAAQGSNGNTLDVLLFNPSNAAPVTIGGFSFGISTATGIQFTDATINTTAATYIFGADSAFGPDITTSTNATTGELIAADEDIHVFDATPTGITLAAGATVGLGEVLFNVPAGTQVGPNQVNFDLLATSFTAPDGTALLFSTLPPSQVPGADSITVTGSAVPEPSSLVLCAIGGGSLLLAGWRRRRSRPAV